MPDPGSRGRFHYAGLGGSGMSALAQFQVMTGGRASGSDRAFDRGERAALRAQLERLGIVVMPQDGSGVAGDCAALVVSTAVEEEVADFAAARARGLPIIHRSELLAHFVASRRTVAVSGTSGKSTVTAMIFEILAGAGRDPSVISGGDLRLLEARGLPGNAFAGGSDLLVVEADESDGSLVRYAPAIGVILNLQRDHKEMQDVEAMLAVLRARSREALVVGEDANLDALAGGALRFGFGPRADIRGEDVVLSPSSSTFRVGHVRFTLPVPGRHNVANALAAIAACRALDVPLDDMVAPLVALRRRWPPLRDRGRRPWRHRDRRLRPQRRQDHRGAGDGEAQGKARARDLSAPRLWADPLSPARFRHHLHPRIAAARSPVHA